MKSPISGLSLLIHLAIIALAMLFGFALGTSRWASFKRTFSANGTSVQHRFILQTISILIILVLGAFMLAATSIAIQTGIREGAREPQVIFVKNGTGALASHFAAAVDATGTFVLELIANNLAAETLTFVRSEEF